MSTEASIEKPSKGKAKSKKTSMLVKLLGVIALITIIVFVIQNIVVITDVRKQTVASNIDDINDIAKSYRESTGLYVEGTMNELDVYTKSDLIQEGADSEQIGEWLATTPGRRPNCFSYVLFIAATEIHSMIQESAETTATAPTIKKSLLVRPSKWSTTPR